MLAMEKSMSQVSAGRQVQAESGVERDPTLNLHEDMK